QFIGTCGSIDSRPDSDLMVPMGDQQGAPALEVFDPLCPTCRAFEQRLKSSGLDKKLARKAVMFPLDKSCNWMLDRQVHAGACAVSEAVLCAGSRADEVVDWAFEHQSEIRSAAEGQPDAARRMVEQAFPELERCVGSPEVQTRLNRSLRWAVKQEIKVLTPQLYVDGVRLCDEDVDLGLEYALTRMIRRQRNGTLVAQPAEGDDS
ncbi:MAG: DsbA family protein, partial [Bradymonadaceae bacterium]